MEHEISRLPIIKIWDQILVPLQGEVTDRLAERLSQEVLDAVHEHGAAGLVIDVTGVWMIDSHLCAVLSHLASCARLMGTRTIISGLSPEIALTLQTMGVELQSMQTALTVEQALEMLGLRVVRPSLTKKVGAAGAGVSAASAGEGFDPRDRSELGFEGSSTADAFELSAQPHALGGRTDTRQLAPVTTRPPRR